jgi:hypothetical protein
MVLEQLLLVISSIDIFFQSLLRTPFNKITIVDFLLRPVVSAVSLCRLLWWVAVCWDLVEFFGCRCFLLAKKSLVWKWCFFSERWFCSASVQQCYRSSLSFLGYDMELEYNFCVSLFEFQMMFVYWWCCCFACWVMRVSENHHIGPSTIIHVSWTLHFNPKLLYMSFHPMWDSTHLKYQNNCIFFLQFCTFSHHLYVLYLWLIVIIYLLIKKKILNLKTLKLKNLSECVFMKSTMHS